VRGIEGKGNKENRPYRRDIVEKTSEHIKGGSYEARLLERRKIVWDTAFSLSKKMKEEGVINKREK